MAETTRKSRMAIKAEVTEGTILLPTGGSDYIALQEGFSLTPAFEQIENSELRASIGRGPNIVGTETPTAEISHYLRNSYVEGTAPNFGLLIKAAFGDTVAYSGTERTTTAGSSAGSATAAATIVLGAGGTDFERGKAVLIKDPTNGYSIRPSRSVSTNTLTLGFNLAVAPATGITVGKPVFYKPSDDQISLALWVYRGNGGATEGISGGKVSEMSFDASAGKELNSSFKFQGLKYFFNPIEIAATDTKFDFLDNAATRAATVSAKIYRDPQELASALQTSMNSLGSANTFTVTYNSTGANAGKFTIVSTGTTLSLLWNTGVNTANTIGDKIGFIVSSDDTGALTYTSDTVQSYASPQTPSLDAGQPIIVKAHEVMIGDFNDYGCAGVQNFSFNLKQELVRTPDVCQDSGYGGQISNGRDVSVDIVLTLVRHDSEKFKRFRAGDTVSFAYNFGSKAGNNWEAGKCGNIYLPDCKITSFELDDVDGIVTLKVTLNAFVDSSGNGEVYLTFL